MSVHLERWYLLRPFICLGFDDHLRRCLRWGTFRYSRGRMSCSLPSLCPLDASSSASLPSCWCPGMSPDLAEHPVGAWLPWRDALTAWMYWVIWTASLTHKGLLSFVRACEIIPWNPQGPDGWVRLGVGVWSPTCPGSAPTQAPPYGMSWLSFSSVVVNTATHMSFWVHFSQAIF